MYFDWKLWAMTRGMRGRIALGVLLGLAALAAGIARFAAFLGQLLALVFQGAGWELIAVQACLVLVMVLLRAGCDFARTMLAHGTAAGVQRCLRLTLFDKIVSLGPAWFGAERT